jgi:hypothetical protein
MTSRAVRVVDPSLGENSAAGKHIPRQSLTQNALYDCEHLVFNPWNLSARAQAALGSVNRILLVACLPAAGPAETEHGGS